MSLTIYCFNNKDVHGNPIWPETSRTVNHPLDDFFDVPSTAHVVIIQPTEDVRVRVNDAPNAGKDRFVAANTQAEYRFNPPHTGIQIKATASTP